MSKLEALSKISALAYLLWLYLRFRERKVPPCETCKHLQCVDVIGCSKKWQCGRSGWLYSQWYDRNMEYCKHYEPRTQNNDDGRGDDGLTLAEDPAEDIW